MIFCLYTVLLQFVFNYWGKGILDPSIKYLISGGNDPCFLQTVRQKPAKRLLPCRLFDQLHFFLFDHQRDHPGPQEFISFFHRSITVSGSDHHLVDLVDCIQSFHINHKQSVAGSSQFNLAFFNFRGDHIFSPGNLAQDPGCFIFMVDSIIFFPYIELVFSHTQKNGDIFLCDNMPFPEPGAFGDPFDDLGQVMTEHLSYRIFCTY